MWDREMQGEGEDKRKRIIESEYDFIERKGVRERMRE